MRIRRALPSDAPGIARVDVESWRSTYVGLLPDDLLASYDYSERERARRISIADESTITFVAEHKTDGIVGFLSGGPARMDDMPYAGELYAIYLLEQHQRQGTGRRLVADLCAWLLSQGLTSMYTWVLDKNPSRRFYESLGGIELKSETITLRGRDVVEVAYGWDDISPLASTPTQL
ncbi:MAG: GNAT family N-acetyltransferase [Chloroflexota bacterium]|nr:GNAT family N-acetyltransferase [Chloroflexota bacterium]